MHDMIVAHTQEQRIVKWIRETLGEENLLNSRERTLRVLEEAIELAQACGVNVCAVDALVERVYSRPQGMKEHEAAGLGMTLVAWCFAHGEKLPLLIEWEINRLAGVDKAAVRKKQEEKFRAGLGLPPNTASLDDQIEALREEAARLAKESNDTKLVQPDSHLRATLRVKLEDVEKEIERLLAERIARMP